MCGLFNRVLHWVVCGLFSIIECYWNRWCSRNRSCSESLVPCIKSLAPCSLNCSFLCDALNRPTELVLHATTQCLLLHFCTVLLNRFCRVLLNHFSCLLLNRFCVPIGSFCRHLTESLFLRCKHWIALAELQIRNSAPQNKAAPASNLHPHRNRNQNSATVQYHVSMTLRPE